MKAKGASVTKAGHHQRSARSGFSYQGVSKTVTFAPSGNYGGNAVYMYKVENGSIKQLG